MSTGEEHQGRSIEASIDVNAAPERVWAAWSDPRHPAGWFADRAEGTATPGETVRWIFESFGAAMEYRVMTADPNERLVLAGPFGNLLEILIEGKAGRTRLTV